MFLEHLLLTFIVNIWSMPPNQKKKVLKCDTLSLLLLFSATLLQPSLSSVFLLPFGKGGRISVNNKTGPPNTSIMRRQGREMGLTFVEWDWEQVRERSASRKARDGRRKKENTYKRPMTKECWRRKLLGFFFPPFPVPPPLSAPQDYGNADAANQRYLREDMLWLENQRGERWEMQDEQLKKQKSESEILIHRTVRLGCMT